METLDILSYNIISGHRIDSEILENKRNKCYFTYDESMKDDSLIHLLSSGESVSSSTCEYSVTIVPCFHFLYVYEGTLEISSGDTVIRCTPSCIAFFKSGETVNYKVITGKCRYYEAVLIGGALAKYKSCIPDSLYYKKEQAGASVLWSSIQLIMKYRGSLTLVDTFKISKWFNDIFTELCVFLSNSSKKKDRTPAYLIAIKNKMDTCYSAQFSLDDLEDEYNISRYRICREFSQYFGISPMHYLNKQRIAASKKLLLTTDLPVHEVGSHVGIDNTNHFINLFKKETGTTPLSFKQAAPVSISELHYL